MFLNCIYNSAIIAWLKKRNNYFFPVLIIVLVTFALFGKTIRFGYAGDDDIFISDNNYTVHGLKNIKEIISDDGVLLGWLANYKSTVEENGFRKRYRPLSQLTFAAEVQFFGKNPHISHLINILLFVLSAILIYLIFFRLLKDFNDFKWYLSAPFLIAIFFISHPIHTEVVANIKSRDEILALLFSLISLLFSIIYFEKGNIKFLVFSSIAFLFALLSKENAITFLAIVPLTIFFFQPINNSEKWKQANNYIKVIIPLIISILIYFSISYYTLGNNNANWTSDIFSNYFAHCNLSQKYGIIFYSLGKYLQLLVFPINLSCDYSVYQIPVQPVTSFYSLASIAIYSLALIFVFRTIKKRSLLGFGIIFYLVTISVYSNLFFSTGTAVAERFLFLPSLGFCIILGYVFTFKLPTYYFIKKWKWIPFSMGLIVFSLYSLKTISRNNDWKDTKTLIYSDVTKPNNCATLNEEYGELLYEEYKDNNPKFSENLKLAKKYFLKAINICPDYVIALNYAALSYYKADKNEDSALFYYIKSLKIKPDQQEIYKNIVRILDIKNDYLYSLPVYEKIISLSPKQPVLNYRLGKAYWKNGNINRATFYMEKALRLSPKYKYPADDLIVIYGSQIMNNKDNYKYYLRLAQLYRDNLRDTSKSISFYKLAIGEFPNRPESYYELAITYYLTGQKRKAAEIFETLNKLSPNQKKVINNLKIIYKELGDYKNLERINSIKIF